MKRKFFLGKVNNILLVKIKGRINNSNGNKRRIKLSGTTQKYVKNLNSISHAKLVIGFKTGKVFQNKKKIIIQNKSSLDYLYNYDKKKN